MNGISSVAGPNRRHRIRIFRRRGVRITRPHRTRSRTFCMIPLLHVTPPAPSASSGSREEVTDGPSRSRHLLHVRTADAISLAPSQLKSPKRYRRNREYPQPPPPSRNNTRRTINIVDIFLPLSPFTGVQVGGQGECVRRSRSR